MAGRRKCPRRWRRGSCPTSCDRSLAPSWIWNAGSWDQRDKFFWVKFKKSPKVSHMEFCIFITNSHSIIHVNTYWRPYLEQGIKRRRCKGKFGTHFFPKGEISPNLVTLVDIKNGPAWRSETQLVKRGFQFESRSLLTTWKLFKEFYCQPRGKRILVFIFFNIFIFRPSFEVNWYMQNNVINNVRLYYKRIFTHVPVYFVCTYVCMYVSIQKEYNAFFSSKKYTWRGPSSGLKHVVQIMCKKSYCLSYWWVCLQKLFHLHNENRNNLFPKNKNEQK
jgi:hypothetical protein